MTLCLLNVFFPLGTEDVRRNGHHQNLMDILARAFAVAYKFHRSLALVFQAPLAKPPPYLYTLRELWNSGSAEPECGPES